MADKRRLNSSHATGAFNLNTSRFSWRFSSRNFAAPSSPAGDGNDGVSLSTSPSAQHATRTTSSDGESTHRRSSERVYARESRAGCVQGRHARETLRRHANLQLPWQTSAKNLPATCDGLSRILRTIARQGSEPRSLKEHLGPGDPTPPQRGRGRGLTVPRRAAYATVSVKFLPG